MAGLGGEANQLRLVLAFAAVYIIWGSTYVAILFAIETLPPFLMAGTRFFTAGVLMYLWALRRTSERPTRSGWMAAAVIGALLLAGGNGGVVWAEQRVPTGLAALLVATVPLWMVLVEWILAGVRPTRRVVLGMGMGFSGLALLIGPADILGGEAADLPGVGALMLGSLSWAFGSVLSRRVPLPASPLLGTGMEMISGGVVLLLFGSAAGEWGRVHLDEVSLRSALAVLYLILFGSLVAFTAYVWLLRHVEVAKVSTYAYVNPVVAVFLGWALVGEPLTPRTLLATAVIVAGVAFITLGRRQPVMERAETAPAGAVLKG